MPENWYLPQLPIQYGCLYHPRQKTKADIKRLKELHDLYPSYGVKRLAPKLGWGRRRTRRIRNLAGIKIKVKQAKRPPTEKHIPTDIENLLRPYYQYKPKGRFRLPQKTLKHLKVYCSDYSYIPYKGGFLYLSVVIDLASRRILSWNLTTKARAEDLILTLEQALSQHPAPDIHHSDQGRQYLSKAYQKVLSDHNIKQSCSAAGKPWENGHVERLLGTIKKNLKPMNRFQTIYDIFSHLVGFIYYYNNDRLHTVLKTTPDKYYQQINNLSSLDQDQSSVNTASDNLQLTKVA